MKKQMMVRYRVAADHAAENERLVRGVFEQLRTTRPEGLRYASFKLADGVSFVHLVSLDTPGDADPLRELPAFQAFVSGIRKRCDEPPVSAPLETVGSYRLFED
jgi:hypothetical protein